MQVKGMAFNARLDFIKKQFGEERITDVMAAVPKVEGLLAASGGFYPSRLYDYEDYVLFNQAISDVLYGGREKAYHDIGADSAEMALTTVHKVFVMNRDVRSFLRSLPVIYSAYFVDMGAVTTDINDKENIARATVTGVRKPHRSLCQVVMHYMKHGMELCGAKNVSLNENSCMCRGGASCDTEVRWS